VAPLLDHFQVLEDFKAQLNVPFFIEIIIVLSWSIWTIRNDFIFCGEAASRMRCKLYLQTSLRPNFASRKEKNTFSLLKNVYNILCNYVYPFLFSFLSRDFFSSLYLLPL